jgi:hypothetical protein
LALGSGKLGTPCFLMHAAYLSSWAMKSGDPGPTEPELIEPELAVELAAPPRWATLGALELPPQPTSSETAATVMTEAGMSVR